MKGGEEVTMRAVRMAALMLLLAGAARAFDVGPGVGLAEPPLLRLTGFVGSAPQGTRTFGRETFGVGSRVVTLELTAVQTLNASLTEGPAALRQFDLYTPNLELIGEPSLLERVREAPEHSQITLWGYVMTGAQRLLLVQVDAR
jgi:hypothetical protein